MNGNLLLTRSPEWLKGETRIWQRFTRYRLPYINEEEEERTNEESVLVAFWWGIWWEERWRKKRRFCGTVKGGFQRTTRGAVPPYNFDLQPREKFNMAVPPASYPVAVNNATSSLLVERYLYSCVSLLVSKSPLLASLAYLGLDSPTSWALHCPPFSSTSPPSSPCVRPSRDHNFAGGTKE